MNRLKQSTNSLERRKLRIRAKISGTKDRPRMSVSISLNHVSAQLIDDTSHSTMVYVSTVGKENTGKSRTEKAAWVGQHIAKAAKTKKIKKVVLDRNGRIYHGRIKALAEAARKEGLEL